MGAQAGKGAALKEAGKASMHDLPGLASRHWGRGDPYRQAGRGRRDGARLSVKEPVLNYGEVGSTKWENRGYKTCCAPPPLRTG